MLRHLLLFPVFSLALLAQAPGPGPTAYPQLMPNLWQYGLATLPTTPKVVITQTAFLQAGWFANKTASTVNVIITDNSTNCTSSGACQVWPTVTIPANTAQKVDFGGVVANGGVGWSASAANAVDGWVKGGY